MSKATRHSRRDTRTSTASTAAPRRRPDPVARAARMAVELLEERTMFSSVEPIDEPRLNVIKSGMNDFAQWANTLSSFGAMAQNLPVIGKSVGGVAKLGQQLQNNLASKVGTIDKSLISVANDLVTQLNMIPGVTNAEVNKVANPGGSGDSLVFTMKFVSTDTAQTTLDLGDNAAGAKLDASAQATLNTSVELNFAFGIDLTPGLAPSEAFFIQLSGTDPANPTGFKTRVALNASNFQFGGNIGIAQVTLGDGAGPKAESIEAAAEVGVSFLPDDDGRITAADMENTSLSGLVNITPGPTTGAVNASIPVNAAVGSFAAEATLNVTDDNLFDAAAPAVALSGGSNLQEFANFKNLTPARLVSLVQQLGASIQGAAQALNPTGGVPFVGSALSQAINFADLMNDLTRGLFDVNLQGSGSYTAPNLASADLTGKPAKFTVTVLNPTDGDPTNDIAATATVQVPAGNHANLADAVNNAIAATALNGHLIASVVDGRLKLSVVSPGQSLRINFAADNAGMQALGFDATLTNATFKFSTVQQFVTQLAAKLGVTTAALDLSYDPATDSLLFNIQRTAQFQREMELEMTDGIELGAGAELAVSGHLGVDVTGTAKVDARVGVKIDQAPVVDEENNAPPLEADPGPKIYLQSGAKVEAAATLQGHGHLSAGLGILEVGIEGADANFSVSASLTMGDPTPGDGGIQVGEFAAAAAASAPSFNAGGTIKLPFELSGIENLGITLQDVDPSTQEFDAPYVLLTVTNGSPISVDATTQGLDQLVDAFTNFSTDDLFAVLKQVISLFQNQDMKILNEPLPLLGKSIKELLAFTGTIEQGLDSISGQFKNLKQNLLTGGGDLATPMITELKKALGETPLLNKLTALLDHGDHLAEHLMHGVHDLEDAAFGLEDGVTDGTLTKLPASLTAALAGLNRAVEHTREAIEAHANPTEKAELKGLFKQFTDALGPITDVLPAVQRLSKFLFDALNLRSLIDDTMIGDLSSQVLAKLDQALAALPAGDAKTDLQAVRDDLNNVLNPPANASNFAPSQSLAAPGDIDLVKLLDVFNGLKKVIDNYDDPGKALADNPNNNSEPGDFVRQALRDFGSNFPGRPTIELNGDELNVGFDFELSKSVTDKLDFDIKLVGGDIMPVALTGGGDVNLQVGGSFSLDFGLDLGEVVSNPLDALFFRDTTDLKLFALAEFTDVHAAASIGAIDLVQLGPDGNRGSFVFKKDVNDPANHEPASITLGLDLDTDTNNDGKIQISEFGFDSFGLTHEGGLKMSLPIMVGNALVTKDDGNGGQVVDPLLVELTDLTDFSTLNFDAPDNLLQAIQDGILNVQFLKDGILKFLDRLTNGFIGDIMKKFPVIGDAIDFGASVLGELLGLPPGPTTGAAADGGNAKATAIVAAASSPAGLLPEPGGLMGNLEKKLSGFSEMLADKVEDQLQQIFFDLLGPGGLNLLILQDEQGTPTGIEREDVRIEVTGDLNAPGDSKIIAHLPLGKKDNPQTPEDERDSITAPFDLGVSGLGMVGFQAEGGVKIAVDYGIDLAFELSKDGGFTLLLNEVNAGDPPNPEIDFNLDVSLLPGTTIAANLFFLALQATDDANQDNIGTSLKGSALVDLAASGNRVSIGDIGSLEFKPALTADVFIDLALTTGITMGGIKPNTNFPTLKADLLVDWDFKLESGGENSVKSPIVELNRIRLNAGEFIANALGPVVGVLDDFLAPIRPILDILQKEIPVISQVSELVGQGKVRFVDAIGFLGEGGERIEKVVEILAAIDQIVDTAKNVGDLEIVWGDLKFNENDKIDQQIAANMQNLTDKFDPDSPDGSIFSQLTGDAKNLVDALRGIVNGSNGLAANALAAKGAPTQSASAIGGVPAEFGTFEIPLFEHPAQIVNLLFGKDIDLVTWDVPRLEASFEFSQLFGPIAPFPLFASIGGGFGVFADFFIGYDTRGLRTGDFLNGLYFADQLPLASSGQGTPEDVPELGVYMEFKAGAEFSIPFAEAGVEGGIRAEINANWNDPDHDGKVHLDELIANFDRGIQCVFDLEGKLDAFIGGYLNIEIPLGFTTITVIDVSFDIFRATIFDFSITCPPLPPPVPATLINGIAHLNIGDRAPDRQPGATDNAEKLKIFGEGQRDEDPALKPTVDLNKDGKITEDELGEDFDNDGIASPGTIALVGFGVTQVLTGVQGIVGNAGADKDEIILDQFVMVPVTLSGGDAADVIVGGAGNDVIDGGADADNITGGAGNDNLTGGDANDKIKGSGGSDTIDGGAGDDELSGGDNDGTDAGDAGDSITGGEGNDRMYGHLGSDTMTGGAGADVLDGGQGNDNAFGGADNDTVLGDTGNDSLEGGVGDDQITGGEGNDTLIGGASSGDLDLFGADLLSGGAGDDVIAGDDATVSNKTITDRGGVGRDTIIGGEGHDVMDGQANADVMLGDVGSLEPGTGNVLLENSPSAGNDTMYGGSNEDTMYGQAGNDSMFGQTNHDKIYGGDGNDTMDGGAGDDLVLGEAGLDSMFGDTGNDTLEGSTGSDTIFGGRGNDRIRGQEDPDSIEGGAGLDTIYGGTGNDSIIGGSSNLNDLGPDLDDADSIQGDNGNDVILGDNGSISAAGHVLTNADGGAGSDTVFGGAGSDTIFGGGLGDSLVGDAFTGTGADVVVGDQGSSNATGIIALHSAVADSGGNDTIFGAGGSDTLLGGDGDDSIDGDTGTTSGKDVALGDNGKVTLANGVITKIETTDVAFGGNDTITGGAQDDILLGGTGADQIDGAAGADIALGDNGVVNYIDGDNDAATPDLIAVTSPTFGAGDTISGGTEHDTIMGGTAGDSLDGDAGDDVVFGDHGKVDLDLPPQSNFTSIFTAAADAGGGDTIHGNAGHDTVLGGQAGDQIFGDSEDDDLIGGHNVSGGADSGDTMDGGTGFDVLAGDNAAIERQVAGFTSPIVRTLLTALMYKLTGQANVDGTHRANPNGAVGRNVTLLDHAAATPASLFGNDLIAGGEDDDSIFGQLGNDTIQGDASINEVVSPIDPSIEAATDGDDYIEGNGGADLIFGNRGQDDIIGGSSSLFGLTTTAMRPDGADVIFGGAGTGTGINHAGDTAATGHADDADFIVGDNGNVYRLVTVAGNNVTTFRAFNYDNYSPGNRIVPRAVDLLDYTADDNASNDNGGADLVHGESGDDSIHGVSGNDILFGDGQDDDVVGESGDDWISGGTGDDGVLGDDGKLMTSRNGTAEPMYGITATAQQNYTSPGSIAVATFNPTGRLNKAVDLEPFDKGGEDTVYGGLGNDSLHGGAANDAISGAEALESYYNNPASTPKLLFNATTGKFVAFNDGPPAIDALKKIDNHPLNFLAFDGNGKINDGEDAIFGDYGHDWLVGGTNSDHLFGGWGNDIMNADDNLESNGGLNNDPDAAPYADADTVYGGAGRDTMLANAGNDRLIDWIGEFNAYIVPFAPFGSATVMREPAPWTRDFLLKLAKSDGADPTRTEPLAELGLTDQKSTLWQDQHGAPVDSQAGNEPGGKK